MNKSTARLRSLSRALRDAGLLFAVGAALASCKRDPPPAPPKQAHACTANDQCARGWSCLAGKCADMAASGLYKHPENAVTPKKIQAEMDRLNHQQKKNAERQLQEAAQAR